MFELSEKYRKYLINIKIDDKSIFTIWGADLSSKSEDDKFIILDNKIIAFISIHAMTSNLLDYRDCFFDHENLVNWFKKKNSLKVYLTIDYDILLKIDRTILNNKELALEFLNCINLSKDYYYQVKNDFYLKVLKNENLNKVTEYIYDNYVWKTGTEIIEFDKIKNSIDRLQLKNSILYKLHKNMTNNIIVINKPHDVVR